MTDDAKKEALEWGKVLIGLFAQLIIGLAFIIAMRGDIDYLKRDVADLKADLKAFTVTASAAGARIEVLSSRLSTLERVK